MKKITKASFKKFIKDNFDNLLINIKTCFDGMTDGCEDRHNGFEKAQSTTRNIDHTFGIQGVWLVGRSNDYFEAFENDNHIGIQVYNSCGQFIIAVEK